MKKYAIISNKKRNQLIQRVVENGESISRVAKQLRMKLPSAKSIIRTYKKSGKIFNKKKVINRKNKLKNNDLEDTQQLHDHSESKSQIQDCFPLKKQQIQEDESKEIVKNKEKIDQEQKMKKTMEFYFEINSFYRQMLMAEQYAYYYNLMSYFSTVEKPIL